MYHHDILIENGDSPPSVTVDLTYLLACRRSRQSERSRTGNEALGKTLESVKLLVLLLLVPPHAQAHHLGC